YAYDPDTDTWTPKASMPAAREGPGAALGPDGRIYVAGGATSYQPLNLEAYDPNADTWAELAPIPGPADHFPLVTGNDNRLYAFGGRSGFVWQYDPVMNSWTVGAPMLTPRGWLAAAALSNGKI